MSANPPTPPSETPDNPKLAADLDRLAAAGSLPPEDLDPSLVELWGSLPLALEPLSPLPGAKERVLAAARDGHPAVGTQEATAARRRISPLLAAAAALIVALLGLVAWQQARLEDQSRLIGRLAGDLAASGNVAVRLGQAQAQLGEERARVAMVTSPGAEFCRLKPAAESPDTASASGMVVVSPDRQSSLFRVAGLEPHTGGRVYRVWFHTPERVVPGPVLEVRSVDRPTALRAGAVPEGVVEISVTLEHAEQLEAPEGPRLLYADEAMRIF